MCRGEGPGPAGIHVEDAVERLRDVGLQNRVNPGRPWGRVKKRTPGESRFPHLGLREPGGLV